MGISITKVDTSSIHTTIHRPKSLNPRHRHRGHSLPLNRDLDTRQHKVFQGPLHHITMILIHSTLALNDGHNNLDSRGLWITPLGEFSLVVVVVVSVIAVHVI
jgi:hypothetical protein